MATAGIWSKDLAVVFRTGGTFEDDGDAEVARGWSFGANDLSNGFSSRSNDVFS